MARKPKKNFKNPFNFCKEMTKKERELIFNKYNGKCAYCGCELKRFSC